MHKAIDKLKVKPEFIAVDGNKFNNYKDIPHQTVIKGDGKIHYIAAASILAKTYRDQKMTDLDKQHPEYLWSKNKGYPTKAHREMIRKHGVNLNHRTSFKLLKNLLYYQLQYSLLVYAVIIVIFELQTITMKNIYITQIAISISFTSCSQDSIGSTPITQISLNETIEIITQLASDEFMGRKPGTDAYDKTVSYVEDFLSKNNIKPYYESGYRDDLDEIGVHSYNIVALIG